MEINNLPDELLLIIFRYLPSSKNVSLVSRRFYEIAIDAHAEKFVLSLNGLLFNEDNRSRLESVRKTKRKIWKVEINFQMMRDHCSQYIDIVSQFRESIKYLEVTGRVGLDDFPSLLKSVPNALHLRFQDVSFYLSNESTNHTFKVPSNVTTLEIVSCNVELLKVLYELPPGVLTDLQLEYGFDLRTLIEMQVFERQKNIKHLRLRHIRPRDFDPSYSVAEILNTLTLESLDYSSDYFDENLPSMTVRNIATLFSKQTKVKSLKLDQLFSDDLMPIVPCLTELETLSLYVHTLSPAFVNIQKLVNLKHLTLTDISSAIFNAFTELDNSRITTLEFLNNHIFPRRALTVRRIRALARSAPKLKRLALTDTWRWETVGAALENFNFVEGISLCGGNDLPPFDQNSSSQKTSVNPQLTELSLNFKCDTSFLQKISTDYPNLKSFHAYFNPSGFRFIVDGFKNLEALRMIHARKLSEDDIVYLRHHKQNLKCLYLPSVSLDLVFRQTKTLELIFGAVRVFSLDHIIMGVDVETMKRWAKQINVHYQN